jgi:hypothetical protein
VVATALWEYICTFGVPKILQHDGEAALVSEVIEELVAVHGIEHRTIAAYNPRQNGKVERGGGTSSLTLRKLLSQCGGDWPRLVPFTQLAINNKFSPDLHTTPFQIFFNRQLNPFASYAELPFDSDLDRAAWLDHQKRVHEQLFPALSSAIAARQRKMMEAFDKSHPLAPPLLAGTVVLRVDNVRASKNDPPYLGPYTIASRISTTTYQLKDPTGALFPRPVPVDQLKVLQHAERKTSARAQALLPPSLPSDQFYVDRLLKHRLRADGGYEYLVRWVGFGPEGDEWVRAVDVDDSLIQGYLRSKTRLPRGRQ